VLPVRVQLLQQQNAELQKQLKERQSDTQPGAPAEAQAEERGLDATEVRIIQI
jgi:hypothetical protein